MSHRAKRCLGGCGRKVERGSWCKLCWPARANGTRDRDTHTAFRVGVLAKDGYRCTCTRPGHDHTGRCAEARLDRLEAHHDQPGTDDPTTGRTLCKPCHKQEVGRYR